MPAGVCVHHRVPMCILVLVQRQRVRRIPFKRIRAPEPASGGVEVNPVTGVRRRGRVETQCGFGGLRQQRRQHQPHENLEQSRHGASVRRTSAGGKATAWGQSRTRGPRHTMNGEPPVCARPGRSNIRPPERVSQHQPPHHASPCCARGRAHSELVSSRVRLRPRRSRGDEAHAEVWKDQSLLTSAATGGDHEAPFASVGAGGSGAGKGLTAHRR